MILAAAGLLLASAIDLSTYYDHPERREMRDRIEACGFEDVRVRKNDAGREAVQVRDTEASDQQLLCAAKEIDRTFYESDFAPELAERYATFKAQAARPRQIAQARARFEREPERGPVPQRLEGETDLQLAKRVETLCGPVATGAMMAGPNGTVTISQEWMARNSADVESMIAMIETTRCMLEGALLADLVVDGDFSLN